jgi:aminoglycoside 6'-N-acetyltransferase I
MAATVAAPDRFSAWLARDPAHRACGLVEASLRSDYVNGTHSTPVVFLEGLYVAPAVRRQGIARELVAAVAAWGRARGCSELASDTPLANRASQAMHRALGFEETERVVYFRKALT